MTAPPIGRPARAVLVTRCGCRRELAEKPAGTVCQVAILGVAGDTTRQFDLETIEGDVWVYRERLPTRPSGAYLSTAEAAALLGVHPKTLERWARAGNVRCTWAGRERRFRVGDLEAYLCGKGPGKGRE